MMPAPGRQRQVNLCEFETILIYIEFQASHNHIVTPFPNQKYQQQKINNGLVIWLNGKALASKPDLSPISGIHMMEKENQFPEVALFSTPHTSHGKRENTHNKKIHL